MSLSIGRKTSVLKLKQHNQYVHLGLLGTESQSKGRHLALERDNHKNRN
jgi:hypothetical protein